MFKIVDIPFAFQEIVFDFFMVSRSHVGRATLRAPQPSPYRLGRALCASPAKLAERRRVAIQNRIGFLKFFGYSNELEIANSLVFMLGLSLYINQGRDAIRTI